MALTLFVPPGCEVERRWIADVVLSRHCGLDVSVTVDPTAVDSYIEDGAGRRLELCDRFFSAADGAWLDPRSLPDSKRDIEIDALPPAADVDRPLRVVLAEPGMPWSLRDGVARLGIDVLGTAFLFLSRYEEAVVGARDEHGRFPAAASIARRSALTGRPIVDEHVVVLRAALHAVWPQLPLRQPEFRVVSTHDVDNPFALLNGGVRGMVRETLSHVRRGRGVRRAAATPALWWAVRRTGPARDPWNTFDHLMDMDEAAGVRGAYYFIPSSDPTARTARALYDLADPAIIALLRRIVDRGHELGIHPSYRAHANPAQLAREVHTMRTAVAGLGSTSQQLGGRHHYLRWQATTSWRDWDDVGLDYDSTVAFAEEPGFRAGTCHPYPAYDLVARRPLRLIERPLVVMDQSLTSPGYLGLNLTAAAARVSDLREECRRVGGEFVILWHNDVLALDPRQEQLLSTALGR